MPQMVNIPLTCTKKVIQVENSGSGSAADGSLNTVEYLTNILVSNAYDVGYECQLQTFREVLGEVGLFLIHQLIHERIDAFEVSLLKGSKKEKNMRQTRKGKNGNVNVSGVGLLDERKNPETATAVADFNFGVSSLFKIENKTEGDSIVNFGNRRKTNNGFLHGLLRFASENWLELRVAQEFPADLPRCPDLPQILKHNGIFLSLEGKNRVHKNKRSMKL
ncbi:iron ABC transporter [Striga asiatica]|uniref:Iron ABC transporter n=1 Tax=Striga asiatica TaxID=4170 RepID=A0A5A7NX62_STRAF|nr:iron ABC transporter [Striga asiatica]